MAKKAIIREGVQFLKNMEQLHATMLLGKEEKTEYQRLLLEFKHYLLSLNDNEKWDKDTLDSVSDSGKNLYDFIRSKLPKDMYNGESKEFHSYNSMQDRLTEVKVKVERRNGLGLGLVLTTIGLGIVLLAAVFMPPLAVGYFVAIFLAIGLINVPFLGEGVARVSLALFAKVPSAQGCDKTTLFNDLSSDVSVNVSNDKNEVYQFSHNVMNNLGLGVDQNQDVRQKFNVTDKLNAHPLLDGVGESYPPLFVDPPVVNDQNEGVANQKKSL